MTLTTSGLVAAVCLREVVFLQNAGASEKYHKERQIIGNTPAKGR
jgi:hypothetical protein